MIPCPWFRITNYKYLAAFYGYDRTEFCSLGINFFLSLVYIYEQGTETSMWNNLWTLYSVTLDTKTAPMAVDIKKMTRLGFSSRYKKSIGFVS